LPDFGEAAGGAGRGGGEAGSRSSRRSDGGQSWCRVAPARGARQGRGLAAATAVMPARGQHGWGNKRHEKVLCKGVEPWGSSIAANEAWKREFTRRPLMADRGAACPSEGVAGVSQQAVVQALVGA
jgi:hypothetical protein